jgi:hypothetical protein
MSDVEYKRPVGCVCTHEEGDSECPVHPTCPECGCAVCECPWGHAARLVGDRAGYVRGLREAADMVDGLVGDETVAKLRAMADAAEKA